MRRYIAAAAIFLLAVAILAACGGEPDVSPSAEPSVIPTAIPTAEPTNAPSATPSAAPSKSSTPTPEPTPFYTLSYDEYFSEVRLYDWNDFRYSYNYWSAYDEPYQRTLGIPEGGTFRIDGDEINIVRRGGSTETVYKIKDEIKCIQYRDGYTLWFADGTEVYRIFLPDGTVDFICDVGYDSSHNAYGSFICEIDGEEHSGDLRGGGTNGSFGVTSNLDISFTVMDTDWYKYNEGDTDMDALKNIVTTWYHATGIGGDEVYYSMWLDKYVGSKRALDVLKIPDGKRLYEEREYYNRLGLDVWMWETIEPPEPITPSARAVAYSQMSRDEYFSRERGLLDDGELEWYPPYSWRSGRIQSSDNYGDLPVLYRENDIGGLGGVVYRCKSKWGVPFLADSMVLYVWERDSGEIFRIFLGDGDYTPEYVTTAKTPPDGLLPMGANYTNNYFGFDNLLSSDVMTFYMNREEWYDNDAEQAGYANGHEYLNSVPIYHNTIVGYNARTDKWCVVSTPEVDYGDDALNSALDVLGIPQDKRMTVEEWEAQRAAFDSSPDAVPEYAAH